MRAEPASVRIHELSKRYNQALAVDRCSLAIEPGELLALLGPSGCGKTTCLRMIAGLVEPTSGEIFVRNRPVTRVPVHKRNIGMLFQNYALFPHLTVARNVAFGLDMRGVKGQAGGRRVREALDLVQLGPQGDKYPSQLSGGQQQRVALARALVIEPAVLLLDEPLGALDRNLREAMQMELRLLQRRLGVTTVMVTHDQEEALTLADRMVVMRDGRLEQVGTPADVYQHPNTRFVAGFLGASNFFRGTVESWVGGSARVQCPNGINLTVRDDGRHNGTVTIALRPEAVRVHRDATPPDRPNAAVATLEQAVYRGFMVHYHLRLPDGAPLLAFRQNTGNGIADGPQPGHPVLVEWDEASNRLVLDEP